MLVYTHHLSCVYRWPLVDATHMLLVGRLRLAHNHKGTAVALNGVTLHMAVQGQRAFLPSLEGRVQPACTFFHALISGV